MCSRTGHARSSPLYPEWKRWNAGTPRGLADGARARRNPETCFQRACALSLWADDRDRMSVRAQDDHCLSRSSKARHFEGIAGPIDDGHPDVFIGRVLRSSPRYRCQHLAVADCFFLWAWPLDIALSWRVNIVSCVSHPCFSVAHNRVLLWEEDVLWRSFLVRGVWTGILPGTNRQLAIALLALCTCRYGDRFARSIVEAHLRLTGQFHYLWRRSVAPDTLSSR